MEFWVRGHLGFSSSATVAFPKASGSFFTRRLPSGPSAIAVNEFPRSGSLKKEYLIPAIFASDIIEKRLPSFPTETMTSVSAFSSRCIYVNSRSA